MKEPIDYETAIQATRDATGRVTLATGFYPSKRLRYRRPRSRSEQQALRRAVYFAVKQARETGLIVRTEDGYTMQW